MASRTLRILLVALPLLCLCGFLLYNLPAPERKVFSAGMPDELLQTLVPVVWKEQWQAMAPFLLD